MSYGFSPAGGALCISPSCSLLLKGCSGPFLVPPRTVGFGLGSTALPCIGWGERCLSGGLRDEGCRRDGVRPGAGRAGASRFPSLTHCSQAKGDLQLLGKPASGRLGLWKVVWGSGRDLRRWPPALSCPGESPSLTSPASAWTLRTPCFQRSGWPTPKPAGLA